MNFLYLLDLVCVAIRTNDHYVSNFIHSAQLTTFFFIFKVVCRRRRDGINNEVLLFFKW
jgi:hypothetical protein